MVCTYLPVATTLWSLTPEHRPCALRIQLTQAA